MSRVIFRVVPRRVVFNNRRFGTLCLFHVHRRVDMKCVKLEASTDFKVYHLSAVNVLRTDCEGYVITCV
jgi:hypothetical protein